MSIGISELVATIGDENIQFQNLDQAIDSINMREGVTKITFGTPQRIDLGGTKMLGLVLWVDRSVAAEAMQTLRKRQGDKA